MWKKLMFSVCFPWDMIEWFLGRARNCPWAVLSLQVCVQCSFSVSMGLVAGLWSFPFRICAWLSLKTQHSFQAVEAQVGAGAGPHPKVVLALPSWGCSRFCAP